MSAAAANTDHTCDACDFRSTGFPRKELLEDGWRWHDIGNNQFFVICGDCEDLYQRRREMRAAVA